MELMALSLIIIGVTHAKTLTRGQPYDDLELMCPKGMTIYSFTAIPVNSGKGTDLRIMTRCKSIDLEGNFKTGRCRDAEEFKLFDGDGKMGENLIGSKSNCAQGEYLAGFRSAYDKRSSTRMLQLHCCKPENAALDLDLGCHHTKCEDPFKKNIRTPLILRNTIYQSPKCPQDTVSAMEVTSKGIALKYCPYRIRQKNYLVNCPLIRRNVVVTKETDGICGKSAFDGGNGNGSSGSEEATTESSSGEDSATNGSDEDSDYEFEGGKGCESPKVTKNMALVGFVREVVDAKSAEECVNLCSKATEDFSFICASGMYYPDDLDQNCLLNLETGSGNPNVFLPEDVDMVYFECSNRKRTI